METYHGHVRTPADAIILFEACRLGSLPRVQRRLSEKERQSIKSGSVFVWDEREAGMRRWTDGKSWSASRVSGSFLTYREMEGKRGGSNFVAQRAGKTPDSTRGSDSDMDMGGDDGPDGYRYKPDGLMKQSFSITTTTGNHLHLISYYSRSDPSSPGLMQPSTDPSLRHIRPQKGMYPESTVHEQQSIPAVTRSPMPGHLPVNMPSQMQAYPPGRPGALPAHPLAFTQPPPGPFQPQWSGPPPAPAYQPYGAGAAQPPPAPGYALHPPAPGQYSQSLPPLSQPATSAPHEGLPRPPTIHSRTPPTAYQPYANGRSPHAGAATLAPPNPSSHHASRNNSPMSTPPTVQAHPGLATSSPRTNGTALPPVRQDSSNTRTPSPAPLKRDFSSGSASRETTASTASTIPSIGALMNGTDPMRPRSRSNSRSPGGTRREGPHDIPHEKLGFGEDMRALRVLDRAFKT